ncbi:hypothetical protein SAMN04515678_12054 [Roseivivax sediminis]|uniref:Uncharacterized protein n=1 Tax=Roseivivax sediminis TaxID=936889 RepID=A0A1I2E6K6_9RHOB|nr:hypothetical protein [Roseivivax sediminis]SFE87900.1 hypothetical protein SAMN04515678_12054 [Roseivivax sediminis]
MAAAGAGRDVDAEGLPPGPWTPEQLAGAISQIGKNRSGIELRTVQLWFQDNQKGISAQNIRWLARIFGCGDTHATSEWQVALSAAQSRTTSKRREKRAASPTPETVVDRENRQTPDAINDVETPRGEAKNLALITDELFKGPSLTLPIIVWVCCGTLWFVAYAVGTHDITYRVSDSFPKQVGFFWSPSWIIGEMILLPMVLMSVSDTLKSWTGPSRNSLLSAINSSPQSWGRRLVEHSLAFKLILVVCTVGIFFLQWAGVYLLPLLDGETDSSMIDWLLVAIKRPDVISTPAAIMVSFLAFLYSGLLYWLYFSSLLLLYVVVSDFSDIVALRSYRELATVSDYEIGEHILLSLFRCAALGSLIALTIKVNAAYLLTDAATITKWFVHDAQYALGWHEEPWRFIHDDASPFFTSFLLLVLTCSVFMICAKRLLKSFVAADITGAYNALMRRQLSSTLIKMACVLGVLALGFGSAGRFYGFSIVVCISVVTGLWSLSWKPRISAEDAYGD